MKVAPYLTLVLGLSSAAATAQALPIYSFTDLGSLGGGNSAAYALNDAGQVAGQSNTSGGNTHATLWSGSSIIDLAPASGSNLSYATAINSSGQVVGSILNSGAVVWSGASTSLLSLPHGTGGAGTGINDSGQVVGLGSNAAVQWSGGTPVDLPTIGSGFAAAYAINNAGQIAGIGPTSSGAFHAMLWNGGTPTDLGTLGGSSSIAFAINAGGTVAGNSMIAGDEIHAALWIGGSIIDLGEFSGQQTEAFAINDSNVSVGRAFSGSEAFYHTTDRALLWENGRAFDLNSMLDPTAVQAGWVLQYATGINSQGWIVGHAVNALTGGDTAFLLKPVPLPSAIWLLGSTLAGLSGLSRRPLR
ncbi:MAG: hypothetical protein HY943_20275 [Gammaproteobacteria bacterium]|nr:hypothetical protein [Gammaproteobacteria bacterium]